MLDNGTGMTLEQLERAMCLGDRSPLDPRSPSDLGRFGLGLKTASFSQAKRLTVVSKPDNSELNSLTWDLDFLESTPNSDWTLLQGYEKDDPKLIEGLKTIASGTLVLWQNTDRLTPFGSDEQDFHDQIDLVKNHLEMVFHRFLTSKEFPLEIFLNGEKLIGWDPFLFNHAATWKSPKESIKIGGSRVDVQCYVLPHKDKLNQKEFDNAAGIKGWTSQQGFYVYRNQRMLVSGNWLGLGRGRAWAKDEAHKLARISVEFNNDIDDLWKIDIRKSVALPPSPIRNKLIRLAETTRDKARRVFAYRGTVTSNRIGNEITPMWMSLQTRKRHKYSIDRSHPVISDLFKTLGTHRSELNALLFLLEKSLPIEKIWLDVAEASEVPAQDRTLVAAPEVVELAKNFIKSFRKKGLSDLEARKRLKSMDPFHHYASLIDSLEVE